MSVVLDIVLPVFGVVGLGYGATRVGWFTDDAESGLAKYVFDFAVPLIAVTYLGGRRSCPPRFPGVSSDPTT